MQRLTQSWFSVTDNGKRLAVSGGQFSTKV